MEPINEIFNEERRGGKKWMSLEDDLLDAIIDLDEQKSYSLVEKLMEESQNPYRIIELLRKGMDVIGERYSNKEYFLTELVMSGEIFQGSIKILGPALKDGRKNDRTKIARNGSSKIKKRRKG